MCRLPDRPHRCVRLPPNQKCAIRDADQSPTHPYQVSDHGGVLGIAFECQERCGRPTTSMLASPAGLSPGSRCQIPCARGPTSSKVLCARALGILATQSKQADQDQEKADKVDAGEEPSHQAVAAVNQPHCDEKGHENDNGSEDWAEGPQSNLGVLDSTAVFELGKIQVKQPGGRTGNNLLPVPCLLNRVRLGRRHVGSPPAVITRPQHLRGGAVSRCQRDGPAGGAGFTTLKTSRQASAISSSALRVGTLWESAPMKSSMRGTPCTSARPG